MPPTISIPPILLVVLKCIFLAFYTSYAIIFSVRMYEKMWAKVQEVAARSKIQNFDFEGPGPLI